MMLEDEGEELLSPRQKMLRAENAARDARINRQNAMLGEITGLGKAMGKKAFTTSRRVDDFIGKNRIITPKYTDEELNTMRKALHHSNTEGYASLKALAERETTNNFETILRGGVQSRNQSLNSFLNMTKLIDNSQQQSNLEYSLRVLSAVNMSKQISEATGYLYHFAPSEARESILKSGFQSVTDDRHRAW